MMVRQPASRAVVGLIVPCGLAAFESAEPDVSDVTTGSAIENESLPQSPSIVITGASGGTLEEETTGAGGAAGAALSSGAVSPVTTICAWTVESPKASQANSVKVSAR